MEKLEDLLESAMQGGSDTKAKEALHAAGRLRAALEKAQTLDEEGGLDGQTLEDRLFNHFLVVHYGAKAPLETPRLPKSGHMDFISPHPPWLGGKEIQGEPRGTF